MRNKAILRSMWQAAILVFVVLALPAYADNTSYTVLDLGPVGDVTSGAYGISLGGQVAGYFGPAGTQQSFYWDDIHGFAPRGDAASQAFAINSNNQVVGSNGGGAYLWDSAGGNVALGSLPGGAGSSTALGINNVGQVVGTSATRAGQNHAFLWDRARGMLDLKIVGDARAINTWGQVVGSGNLPGGSHAYLWTPTVPNGKVGTVIDLGTLGGATSVATAINDNRQVLGYSTLAGGGTHGFIWDETNGMVDMGVLSSGNSFALGMNSNGQAVGYATATGASRALYWASPGVPLDLNTVLNASGHGWTLLQANAINDMGWIVGTGSYNGEYHAFALEPPTVTQVTADPVHFQTQPGQSMWSSGTVPNPLVLDIKAPWGPTDVSLFDFSYSIPYVATVGAKGTLSSTGNAGVKFQAGVKNGNTTVKFPITFKVQFPDKQDILPGQTFLVTSSYTLDTGASLNTKSPHPYATLGAYLTTNNGAGIDANASLLGDLFGGTSWNHHFDLFDLNVNEPNYTIFDSDKIIAENKDLFNISDILFGTMKLPNIDTHGVPTNTAGYMTSQGFDTFFNLRFSVTNLISEIWGISLSHDYDEQFDDLDLNFYYALLQLSIGLGLGIEQTFDFTPTPEITLNLNTPVSWIDANGNPQNGQTISFNAGQSISITMPSGADPVLKIKPTYTLTNVFSNKTTLIIQPNGQFVPLQLDLSLSYDGYELFNLPFVIGPFDWAGSVIPLFDLFNRQFPLTFSSQNKSSITIVSRNHIAPILSSLTPAQGNLYIVDVHHPGPALTAFKSFVASTTTITIAGANFTAGSQAQLEYFGTQVALQTSRVNSSTIKAKIPNRFLLLPGVGRITVTDAAGNLSNSLDFTIAYPTPNLTAAPVNLWAADPNLKDSQLVVAGNNFIGTPDYYWAQDATHTSRLVQSFWSQVFPNDPSMPAFFPDFPYFNSGGDSLPMPTVYWNSQALSLEVVNPDGSFQPPQLPRMDYDHAQQSVVYITNPTPGGGASTSLTGLIAAPTPAPTLAGVQAPGVASLVTSIPPGSSDFTLIVQGTSQLPSDPHNLTQPASGFVANSIVFWNGSARPTQFFSAKEIHASITAADVATAGSVNITVGNPWVDASGNTGIYTSGAVVFSVGNPLPVLTGLNPASVLTADPSFANPNNIALTGSNFVSGCQVQFNGTARPTTFVSSSLLTATLSPTDVMLPGSFAIAVTNPGGGTSNTRAFTVGYPLKSVGLQPGTVFGTQNATGTVNLTNVVLADTVISLASDNPAVSVPATVTVKAGDNAAKFAIMTTAVTSTAKATITATQGSVSTSAVLTVQPIGVQSIGLAEATIKGGKSVSATVTLQAVAPQGGVAVTFSSDNPTAASVPSGLTVLAGASTARFTIKTAAVTANTVVHISATANGVTQTVALTVTP